jgi:cytochrome c biogenesis protein CcmG/thiol:disulfide interchange protein DsbE
MNWDSKIAWRGLMALLLVLGVTWIAFSRVSGQEAIARGEPPPSPQVGFIAPDFTLETRDGGTISLADLRGQAVLVNFWATWCSPCQAEMPAIQQVYDRYRDQGFTVLAVNHQEGDAQVGPFADQMGLTLPILMDRDGSVSARYRVNGLPSTFFVDRAGVVRNVTLGGPMTAAFIESQVTSLLATDSGR